MVELAPAQPRSALDEPGPAAVVARDLVRRYGGTTALDGLSVTVPTGAVHGLLGPNGAGKTTFLRALFGLVTPESGTLEVLGRAAGRPQPPDRRVAGFVDAPHAYPALSARRNLELLAAFDDVPGRDRADRVEAVLAAVGLTAVADRRARGFSRGMRQRLGIAGALLREPALLVLDEPGTGLDPAGLRDVHALVRDLAARGVTVLISSHDMAEVEDLCTSLTIVAGGRAVAEGPTEVLRARAGAAAHRLHTSDDAAAVALATADVEVAADIEGPADVGGSAQIGTTAHIETTGHIETTAHVEAGLRVTGTTAALDGYVLALAAAGIAVRDLRREQTPLGALFFALTGGPA